MINCHGPRSQDIVVDRAIHDGGFNPKRLCALFIFCLLRTVPNHLQLSRPLPHTPLLPVPAAPKKPNGRLCQPKGPASQ